MRRLLFILYLIRNQGLIFDSVAEIRNASLCIHSSLKFLIMKATDKKKVEFIIEAAKQNTRIERALNILKSINI